MRVVAIDGTWARHCLMMDASGEGAKLSLMGSLEGLQLKEFFLLLSTTGSSFRRCEIAWINGEEMGVKFIETPVSAKGKHKTEIS